MGFELRHGETLPLICLRQERPFLGRTDGRGLTFSAHPHEPPRLF